MMKVCNKDSPANIFLYHPFQLEDVLLCGESGAAVAKSKRDKKRGLMKTL